MRPRRQGYHRKTRQLTTFQRPVTPGFVPREIVEVYQRGLQDGFRLQVATGQPSAPQVDPEKERRFRLHAERWYSDTLVLSSYFEKILHPDYQKILTLGTDVVPLILRELRDMPNDWFWALRIITETDPVQPEQAGDMQAMADAWLTWGHDKGYI